jgi:UDP-N-acetylmuramate--alanine ligase
MVVMTHLELDHPDCFLDLEAMASAFRAFLCQVQPQGTIVGCGDAPNVRSLLEELEDSGADLRVLTYGLGNSCDWVGRDLATNGQGGIDFMAWHHSTRLGRVQLSVPGLHNVRNALAALAVGWELGVAFECAGAALSTFQGTERRFEVKGDVGGITVVDDYAHHPTQIRATLAAARRRYGARTLWAVFQPHTYSRTRALLDEYANSFADADHVIVTDIYAARESDDLGISAADMVARMTHTDSRCITDLGDVMAHLLPRLRSGDVLITLGAGDGYTVGEGVLAALDAETGDRASPIPAPEAGRVNSGTQHAVIDP